MHDIIHPEGWKAAKGYANGIRTEGGRLYIGGQIGWNENQLFDHHDFVGQAEQALINIANIVQTAGGTVTDIVRLTWYVTDKTEYLAKQAELGAAYRRIMGKHFPAMTMIVVQGLIEDEALVEIEATAECGAVAARS